MHTPGHNPYIGSETGNWGDGDFGYYSYSLPGNSIYSALSSVFAPDSAQMTQAQADDFYEIFGDALLTGSAPQFDPNSVHDLAGWQSGVATNWDDLTLPSIPGASFNEQGMLPVTNIFDPESIAASLSFIGGMAEPIRAGEVQALTPEMLEKTESKYYNPYEEAERETLVEKLGQNIAGAKTGGFAGSGARQSGLSAADRLYSSGYGDVIADILKMKAGATGDVMDTIYGWQELLSEQ